MKGIVIHDSSYGNTKKVAEVISDTLKESGIEVDTFYVKNVKNLRADDYDFLVIGSPTRWGARYCPVTCTPNTAPLCEARVIVNSSLGKA